MRNQGSTKEIAKALFEIEAIKLDPDFGFTWASGIKSPIYCDNRKLISYPTYRELVADSFAELVKREFPQVQIIAGTATAGIPHAAWVAQKLELPMLYVRNKAKGHGKSQQIEGVFKEGENVILIEDLISTGKSSINAYRALEDSNLKVQSILSIMSYETKIAKENFSELGINTHSLIRIEDIIGQLDLAKQEEIRSFLNSL